MLKTPYLSKILRFSLLVIASLLFVFNQTAHAEWLSGLKESLNKGKTSIKVSDDKDAKLLKTKVNSTSNKSLNAFKKYDPYRMLENTKEVYIDKANLLVNTIKIKTNHPKSQFLKTSEETIKKLKKLKPTISSKQKQFKIPQIIEKRKSATRIDDLVKLELPARADKTETAPSITVPSPEKDFNFPLDKNDKIRISGEIEVQRLYELAISTIPESAENEAIIQKMMTIADEIFKKYNAYPDLCAISKFYIIDAWAHLNIDSEYSNGSLFPAYMVGLFYRDYFKKYLQIMLDYNHETSNPNISKLLSYIYENRIKIIMNNDDEVYEYIEYYSNELKEDVEFLDRYVNGTAFPSEDPEMYIGAVVSTINAIIEDYKRIYNCSVTASDYEFAEYLLNSEFKDGKLTFSGAIKEFYDSIPKEVPYHYVSGYDEQNKPIIKTKIVEIYKTPARLIEVIQSHRNAELFKYNQTFLDDEYNTNITQKKIEAISEWFKNYEPDREGKNGTPEKMSQSDVDYLHNNAYGPDNYYKNSHVIKKIYFTRNENVKIVNDIPHSTDLITVRAEIETSINSAPFYEYKVKIQNARLPKRYKHVIMKKDYFTNGYYSKFRVNENNEYEPDPENPEIETPGNIEDPTPPAIASILINKTENKEYKNIINLSENKGTSIACYNCEFFYPPLFTMYYNNKYFFNFTSFLQNRKGYAIRETMYDNALYLKNVFKQNNTDYFKANIFEADKTFLKTGGFEYVTGTGNKEHEYLPVVSQADWFVIDSHGWFSNDSGGIAENEVDENGEVIVGKELLRMHVNELLDDNGKSCYSFGMDVLILSCCHCLKWFGFDLENDKKSDWCYAKGWHKVLPEGIILGYKDDTNFAMSRQALKILSYKINAVDKKLTNDELMYMWIEIHEELYGQFIGKGEVKYRTAKEWAIINKKIWISAKPGIIICGYTNNVPSYQFADFYAYSFNN